MTPVDTLTKMAVLKHSTKEAHVQTERVLIPYLKNISRNEDYIRILKIFYGFYRPVQHSIDCFINESNLPDKAKRRKAAWILDDLLLAGDSTTPEICASIPVLTNKAQAFGALYVLEGSTLGGEIIVQMLKKNTSLHLPPNAFSFFAAYGENNSSMWKDFGEHLENAVTAEPELQAATDAANETFVKLKQWMLKSN